MLSIVHFYPHFRYNRSYSLIKTKALVFYTFLEYLKLVLDDIMDEESETMFK